MAYEFDVKVTTVIRYIHKHYNCTIIIYIYSRENEPLIKQSLERFLYTLYSLLASPLLVILRSLYFIQTTLKKKKKSLCTLGAMTIAAVLMCDTAWL